MNTIFSGLTVIIFLMIATSAYSGVLVSEYQSSECLASLENGKSVFVCDNGDRSKTYVSSACSKIPTSSSEDGFIILCKEFNMTNTGYDFDGLTCDGTLICLNGQPKPVLNPATGEMQCKCPKLGL